MLARSRVAERRYLIVAAPPSAVACGRCDFGLRVDGDDVTMYSLAVEHTLKDLTVWNGERGRTYFYQSELPYGVTQAQFGDPGCAQARQARKRNLARVTLPKYSRSLSVATCRV